ncbi:WD40 repeat domain-containing protein, partial [Nonomuraea sp. NPDC059007]|uniref:WD40 repeat domain-containing protein n=1 Tax=Nonomuraea sp. NPDC059007 TaxID=3346692 RepID=UPI0036C495C4
MPGRVAAFAFGRGTLFTGTGEGRVSVWSLRTRSLVRSFSVADGSEGDLPPVALAAAGSRLIAQHGSLSVWDPGTGRRAGRPIAPWVEPRESDDVGPYASKVGTIEVVATTVYGVTEGELRSWDLRERSFLRNYLAGRQGEATYIAFAAGAGFVAAAEETGSGRRVVIWDAASQRRARTLTGHVLSVTTLAAGTLNGAPALLSGSADNTIRLWDPGTGRELGRTESAGPVRPVHRIVPATVGGRPLALTADGDGLLRLWDLRGRTLVRRSFRFAPAGEDGVDVRGLAVTELGGGPVAVVAHRDLMIVDLSTLTAVRTLPGLGEFQLLRRDGRPAVVAREAREDRARLST